MTGLPKANPRHALTMARFAQDCLNHITKVTKLLAETLGEDTLELTMRIGLHSGSGTCSSKKILDGIHMDVYVTEHQLTFLHIVRFLSTRVHMMRAVTAGVLR